MHSGAEAALCHTKRAAKPAMPGGTLPPRDKAARVVAFSSASHGQNTTGKTAAQPHTCPGNKAKIIKEITRHHGGAPDTPNTVTPPSKRADTRGEVKRPTPSTQTSNATPRTRRISPNAAQILGAAKQ
ncbi:hypothetical protein AA106556_0558 [Neokomagataea tanensis NBRC 106556]|uniref:Uncharacterized protein n=1 Tax=Neokomagataea tanensis NBRC 106556 TaxID=1223519 RepID=A0ABQ0QHC4_9PROT|nr:hypothetical protein AA106556_0558 [Neokomagataea tanensis NBRC 106556]